MQLKRILAIFLAAALILSAFTVSVGAESLNVFEVGVAAETTTPVSSSPVIYNACEEVKVTISAVQKNGIDYLRLKVSYEPEALEYVGYTTNELFGVNNLETIQNKNGYLLFTAVLNEVSSATGDMFTINFKTKDSFCGETEVVAQLSNNDESNCMITDPDLVTVVPFVGDSTSFEIHKIDTANGVVTEPTCTEQGYTTYSCANCDVEVRGNYVAANGHTEAEAVEENRVEADCTNNGSYDMVVYCSVCNAELSRESFVIDAHGHSPLDAVEENRVEATCTNNGSYDMVVYCSVCNAELSRESFVIDAHGHSPLDAVEENRVEPTCTNKGSYDMVVYCDICDAELSRENFVIDALGHDTIPHDSKVPTCTEIGWEAYNTCSRCDYTTYVELAALGHDIIHHDAKAPTCTEIGWKAYDTCSRCDYTTYEEIAAHGHSPLDAVEENRVEPTCTNKGSYDMVVYCDICDAELSRENFVIDALGHDTIPHDSKVPTCTEIGWEAYNTCSRCDYTTYVELAALGHDIIHHDAKAPTCTEIGWKAYDTCSRCDYTTYEEIAAHGHTYGESTVVEPEYKVEGYTTHTCKVCNYEEKYDITPALTYILGDTNGNEVVDSEDAINLLYYTLLPESISINQKCDFDGDGDVDSDDAIYLLYYTLLPEQYPLHK